MKRKFSKITVLTLAAGMMLSLGTCSAMAEETTENTTESATESAEGTAAEAGTYVFEAENVDLTYLSGHGWSNEVTGVGLLVKDDYNAEASNGYALGYLYENGNEVEFYINSDQDVDDVTLVLRCTMENKAASASLAWDEFEITVNDGNPIEYRTMTFDNIPGLLTVKNELLPFANKTIGNISLQEGENLIKLTVTNDITMEGTMQATAPIIDCITLETDSDAVFSWAEGFPMNDDYIEANR
ncbi:MAG: hypothetical protein PHR92_02045 [Lachnospiraceae bacterium]|nr:hypothetical protein [Lachnospiraceae bacterium]